MKEQRWANNCLDALELCLSDVADWIQQWDNVCHHSTIEFVQVEALKSFERKKKEKKNRFDRSIFVIFFRLPSGDSSLIFRAEKSGSFVAARDAFGNGQKFRIGEFFLNALRSIDERRGIREEIFVSRRRVTWSVVQNETKEFLSLVLFEKRKADFLRVKNCRIPSTRVAGNEFDFSWRSTATERVRRSSEDFFFRRSID